MPLGVPPLAFAWSLPAAAPGAAAGCWACTKRVISAARAATNTGAVRSFMTHDCTRYGGRLLRGQVQRLGVASQLVTMVMGVFAPWSAAGDPAARHPDEARPASPSGRWLHPSTKMYFIVFKRNRRRSAVRHPSES